VKQAEREKLVLEWRERWNPLLLQILARRLPVPADVSDLAQEVYLRLLRVDKLDLVHNPRAYLCRVAVNIASEWRLRSARLPTTPSEDVPEHALVADDDLEQWLDKQQNREAVKAALLALPASHRTALVLHVSKDLTYPQIAEQMSVTGRQVKRYLAKAYDQLRRALIAAEN
jgi:RNA polymerase sigma factor (sigma-70 family)